jgi:hypothetical protein
MAWLSVTGTILYYILYPVLLVGRLLFYIVQWVLTPFIYIGYIVKETTLIPLRFLAEFEASNCSHDLPTRSLFRRHSGTSWELPSSSASSLLSVSISPFEGSLLYSTSIGSQSPGHSLPKVTMQHRIERLDRQRKRRSSTNSAS